MTTEAADPPTPEPGPAPTPQAAPDLPAPVAQPESVLPRPRRRGRTALIMAGAVVLGVLGGAGAGYAVQAGRTPTPLPALAVAQPSYPAARVSAPAPDPANDDQAKTDGDLTALLVPAPTGAKPEQGADSITSWMDLAAFAETRSEPGTAFSWYASNGFRRAAQAVWVQGNRRYALQLVQFAHDQDASALQDVSNLQSYQSAATSVLIPGTVSGRVYPGLSAQSDNGPSYYLGQAFAQHGDISVQIQITSDSPVSAQTLLTLVQRQLERL
ncbi:hypothetical protein [Streptacidiphilus sp. EB129]|uniref:hypothetical protein n=1 Tax=Streptacidiphilus sp. EB129 TaxID=3156262 RepID=UPI00351352F0